MERVALLGSGDFAKRVINVCNTMEDVQIVGMFDGNQPKSLLVHGLPILGNDDEAEALYRKNVFDSLFICIGYAQPALKKRLYERFHSVIPFAMIIHPTAVVHPSVSIGEGVLLSEGVIAGEECRIEDNVAVWPGALLSHNAHIEKHTFIAGKAVLAGDVHVGQMCFVGMNCSIREHINIGHEATIGMGSVVVKDVLNGETVVGNPAKAIRRKEVSKIHVWGGQHTS